MKIEEIKDAVCVAKADKWFCFREYRDGACETLHGSFDGRTDRAQVTHVKRFHREKRRQDALLSKLLADQFKVLWRAE